MAQATPTPRNATPTKATAPKATPTKAQAVTNGTAPTQQATGTAAQVAATPQAKLYGMGHWPANQRGHRGYACGIAKALAASNPNGFTLAAFKVALIGGAAASTMAPPAGGWAAHNMPTWAANPKNSWLLPVA